MRSTLRQRLTATAAIVLLASAAVACSLARPQDALTWQVVLQVSATEANRDEAVRQTVEILRRRLNAFGVYRSEVQARGDRVLVKLSEVPDRERLKKIITARGRLELVAIVSPSSPAPVQTYDSKEEATASLGGTVPANRRVLRYFNRNEPTAGQAGADDQPARWVVVESPAIVDGSELRSAAAMQGRIRADEYLIQFSLKPEGAQKFGAWTGANINRYLGVVLNDEVKSTAYIKSQIFDLGEINGRFTKQSAEDLALVLQSGALPVPVRVVEEGGNST